MVRAFVSLGSNLGDRARNLGYAVHSLNNLSGKIIRRSSVYETQPVGGPPQGKYYNCVCEIETILSPDVLLESLKGIEKIIGRRPGARWGPRIIDLDILFYDDICLKGERLVIPHPRFHERRFVVVPMVEISPDHVHPVMGLTISEIATGLKDDSDVRKLYAYETF